MLLKSKSSQVLFKRTCKPTENRQECVRNSIGNFRSTAKQLRSSLNGFKSALQCFRIIKKNSKNV